MNITTRNSALIYTELLTDAQRVAYTAKLFALNFPFRLEPAIFDMAGRLSETYSGGFWHFHALSNGGFYMAPSEGQFRVRAENGFDDVMTADAFGLTVCLYCYSQLSFRGDAFSETCAEHFHLLRELAIQGPDWGLIGAAID